MGWSKEGAGCSVEPRLRVVSGASAMSNSCSDSSPVIILSLWQTTPIGLDYFVQRFGREVVGPGSALDQLTHFAPEPC